MGRFKNRGFIKTFSSVMCLLRKTKNKNVQKIEKKNYPGNVQTVECKTIIKISLMCLSERPCYITPCNRTVNTWRLKTASHVLSQTAPAAAGHL